MTAAAAVQVVVLEGSTGVAEPSRAAIACGTLQDASGRNQHEGSMVTTTQHVACD